MSPEFRHASVVGAAGKDILGSLSRPERKRTKYSGIMTFSSDPIPIAYVTLKGATPVIIPCSGVARGYIHSLKVDFRE